MGGDAIEDVKPIPAAEYGALVSKVLLLLKPVYIERVEPYLPLPQKEQHGDLDFLVLGHVSQSQQIVKVIGATQVKRNGSTFYMDFQGHQADFHFVADEREFQFCHFYTAYGGLGSILGGVFHRFNLKLTNMGLFYKEVANSKKIEVLLTDDKDAVLQFSGLDPKHYSEGFKTRQQLLQFIIGCKYLRNREEQPGKKKSKLTKLMKALDAYIAQNKIQFKPYSQDLADLAIKRFGKREQVQAKRPFLFQKRERQ